MRSEVIRQVAYQGRINGTHIKGKAGMFRGITGVGLLAKTACFSESRIARFTARREVQKLRCGTLGRLHPLAGVRRNEACVSTGTGIGHRSLGESRRSHSNRKPIRVTIKSESGRSAAW